MDGGAALAAPASLTADGAGARAAAAQLSAQARLAASARIRPLDPPEHAGLTAAIAPPLFAGAIAAGRPGGPVSPGSFAGSIAPTEWSA